MNIRTVLCCVLALAPLLFTACADSVADEDELVNDRSVVPVISASKGTLPDRVEVRWSPVEGAAEYLVYSAESRTGMLRYIGSTSQCVFSDTSPYAYSYSWYAVQSVTSAGYSADSDRDCGYVAAADTLMRIDENPSFGVRNFHSMVSFANRLWIIGGYCGNFNEGSGDSFFQPGTFKNDVWASDDGISWELVTDTPPWADEVCGVAGRCAVLNGYIYAVGGRVYSRAYNPWYSNEVWRSSDGFEWERVSTPPSAYVDGQFIIVKFTPRAAHQLVSFDGALFVIGGWDGKRKNDVWKSTDGRTWTKLCDAPFCARMEFGAAAFSGRIWVVGGNTSLGHLSDVWSSADGISWRLETNAPGFSGRRGHELVAHGGRLRVIGGVVDNDTYFGDIWSSADGVTWEKDAGNEGFVPSGYMGAASHNGRLFIASGLTKNTYLSGIWVK